MAFEIDILIVHADVDNEPADDGAMAWVSQFKKFLEFMLNQVLSEKTKILLKGEYDSMTSPSLDNVAILIPVMSKEFVASSACLEHVQLFCNAAGKNSDRIFKVGKAPITLQEQPEILRSLIGYDMYQLDPDSGEIREYKDYFSEEAERQYWMEIVDLSYDIAETLTKLKNKTTSTEVRKLFNSKVVYLAETGHDLSVERSIITRELQRNGYTVLPDQALPDGANEIERVVRRDLENCSMSIHLIGNTYGETLTGDMRSIADLQYTLASEKSQDAKKRNSTFQRLIWITPHRAHQSERQKTFIESVKRDVEMQDGAEVLETPLEDFKSIIREELLEAIDRRNIKETGGRAIYFLYNKGDHTIAQQCIELIERCGFHVLMPSFEGELLQQRQKHIENLRIFDAAIIYKGTATEQWVRMKAMDLLKAPGFGRKKPITAKAIMSNAGELNHKDTFKAQNFLVYEENKSNFAESVKLFLLEFTP
jgi:hypothetical protein